MLFNDANLLMIFLQFFENRIILPFMIKQFVFWK